MSLRQKLASQSAVIFAMRIAGAGLIFLAQAAMARLWGSELLGEYLLIVAAVNLIAVVLPLGFQTIGTYFAAEYRARGEGRMLRHFLVRCYGHIVVAALAFALFGPLVLPAFGPPGAVLAQHWLPACLLAVGTATVFVNGAVLVGMKRPFAGFFADTLFRPMAVAAGFGLGLLAVKPSQGFADMLWLVSLGYIAIALVQFGFVVATARAVPADGAVRARETARWWRFAMPWVLISFAGDFFFDIDLLLLSGQMDRHELAVFGVCTRIFSLVSFGIGAVYAVTIPDMFEAEALKDRDGFNRRIGDANLVAAAVSVALFLGVLVGGPVALMLFGPDFAAGALPLAVLCLVLVVRAAFGPASLVLSINDRPWASLPAIVLGLATLFFANLVLVPLWGLMGAACAALLAIALWSAGLWLTALCLTRLDVSVWPRLREFAGTRRQARAV